MKHRVFALLHALGLTRLAAWLNRRRTVILCYHGVTGGSGPAADDTAGLHVRAERFERQLDYLRRHFHVLSLSDFLAARHGGQTLPLYSLVLTFDDGYRNFLTAAAPRLRTRGMPATVFLVTGWTPDQGARSERDWSPADDRAFLSWSEVKELGSNGQFQFGSHTRGHRKLAEISAAESEREMRDALADCTSRLCAEPLPLAYPYGSHTAAVNDMARALGHSCALTTDGGANGPDVDLFRLRRTLVGDGDDEAAFAMRVSQLAFWLSAGRK